MRELPAEDEQTEVADDGEEEPPLVYEPNPKHKPGQAPGRRGSLCPPGVNAQSLLAESVIYRSKRYATDGGRAYCAHEHQPGRWHGFPVDWDEVPPRVKADWVGAGKVERRTIRRAKARRAV